MRFQDVELIDINLNGDTVDFQLTDTDELIETLNNIRKRNGYEDLVSVDLDNDTYYNFYLVCNLDNNKIELLGVPNNSVDDDWTNYGIGLFPEEEKMFMWKVIKMLKDEIER